MFAFRIFRVIAGHRSDALNDGFDFLQARLWSAQLDRESGVRLAKHITCASAETIRNAQVNLWHELQSDFTEWELTLAEMSCHNADISWNWHLLRKLYSWGWCENMASTQDTSFWLHHFDCVWNLRICRSLKLDKKNIQQRFASRCSLAFLKAQHWLPESTSPVYWKHIAMYTGIHPHTHDGPKSLCSSNIIV